LDSLALSLPGSPLTVRVVLTLNLPEPDLERSLLERDWPFVLEFIRNSEPMGFGANHNQAFALCEAKWFAIVNPDIFWPAGHVSFWDALKQDTWPQNAGMVCPQQHDFDGRLQDFTRELVTPWGLAVRIWNRWCGFSPSGVAVSVEQADWVNGACMIFRAKVFAELKGFNERYFMYCEDTDICLRLALAGWVIQGVELAVVHDARRNTGRSWRHLTWHLRSLWRLWTSEVFWRFVRRVR
jgi:hypothetical protein